MCKKCSAHVAVSQSEAKDSFHSAVERLQDEISDIRKHVLEKKLSSDKAEEEIKAVRLEIADSRQHFKHLVDQIGHMRRSITRNKDDIKPTDMDALFGERKAAVNLIEKVEELYRKDAIEKRAYEEAMAVNVHRLKLLDGIIDAMRTSFLERTAGLEKKLSEMEGLAKRLEVVEKKTGKHDERLPSIVEVLSRLDYFNSRVKELDRLLSHYSTEKERMAMEIEDFSRKMDERLKSLHEDMEAVKAGKADNREMEDVRTALDRLTSINQRLVEKLWRSYEK